MDIVYICRPGDTNEELRYSLRSLRNLPHERVWFAGYTPTWVTGVGSIPVADHFDKQTSALKNLIAACQSEEVSDPFLIFNDDFYIMQPLEQMPVLHRGLVSDVIEEHRNGSAYRIAMERTLALMQREGLKEPILSYELHVPMAIEKLSMLLALSLGKGIRGFHLRTFYGNMLGIGGERTMDFKIYRTDPRSSAYRDWPLLSTSDQVFRTHPAGRYLRSSFPEPSIYEQEPPKARVRSAVRYTSALNRL